MTTLLMLVCLVIGTTASADDFEYLGKYSSNSYDPESISNPYSTYGSEYSGKSVNNPYSEYGSQYSQKSAANPYATDAPKIYSSDGTYLGKISSNKYDPESTSNPYGKYGSEYSPTSINNKYGKYGSDYSNESVNNPYATDSPKIYSAKESPYKFKRAETGTDEDAYPARPASRREPARNSYGESRMNYLGNQYSTPKSNDYTKPASIYGKDRASGNTYKKQKGLYGY